MGHPRKPERLIYHARNNYCLPVAARIPLLLETPGSGVKLNAPLSPPVTLLPAASVNLSAVDPSHRNGAAPRFGTPHRLLGAPAASVLCVVRSWLTGTSFYPKAYIFRGWTSQPGALSSWFAPIHSSPTCLVASLSTWKGGGTWRGGPAVTPQTNFQDFWGRLCNSRDIPVVGISSQKPLCYHKWRSRFCRSEFRTHKGGKKTITMETVFNPSSCPDSTPITTKNKNNQNNRKSSPYPGPNMVNAKLTAIDIATATVPETARCWSKLCAEETLPQPPSEV